MARMLGNNETAFDSARSQFWVVDAKVDMPFALISSHAETVYSQLLEMAIILYVFLLYLGSYHRGA